MGGNGGCLKGVALPDDSQMPCGLSEIGTKSRLAVRPITLVAAASNVPPTTPPTSETPLTRFTAPLDPAFVTSLKPTA